MNTTQNYELYLIFDSSTEAETAQKKIETFLKNAKASNSEIEREGVRRLAYPINKHANGLYYLVNFDLELGDVRALNNIVTKFNQDDAILRYILVNITEYNKQKAKEKLNPSPETTNHRELNKGAANKKCVSKYLGIREINYRDQDFIAQFVSPYAKIFGRTRTGSSSKYQRKINTAIKRARHMALLPFTTKWME